MVQFFTINERKIMIVAFEGIDACGKATQVRMLNEFAQKNGIRTTLFDFPNYRTVTGKKIRELLQSKDPDPLVLQSLMTVNRCEAQEDLVKAQIEADLIILDRYWLSGLVYGKYDGLDSNWLWSIHKNLIQPHLWFLLEIPVSESFKRRPHREDAYESNYQRLQQVERLYRGAFRSLTEHHSTEAHILDATKSAQEIHAKVTSLLV